MRPFHSKKPLHLVFRSTKAKGPWSFLHGRNKGAIHSLLLDISHKWGGLIYGYENVGNHLHMIARFKQRADFQRFLKEFTQKVMFLITGARKGNPQGKFFASIVYSRVLEWGRSFRVAKNYLWKNALEALGFSGEAIKEFRGADKHFAGAG